MIHREPEALRPGHRVQVKEQYDETLQLMGLRTTPGYIDWISKGTEAVVYLDSGQSVPYPLTELDREVAECELCRESKPLMRCCDGHDKKLCDPCYGRSHFVEVTS